MTRHLAAVTTIKSLTMDAVQAAKSGHPGMPLGAADMAVALWTSGLVFDPADPAWPDRDRFILSAGHGSMLLYSLLHLAGYDLSLDDIKAFRQWGSRTPGHPEYRHTPGVEMTTGPLGQGFATGVGMAVAERWLRERFGESLCSHFIYGIVSDGDLMEGISYEAASLAGHLGLGRLIYLYDDNRISIDGATDLSFTEDRLARFAAAGWHTLAVDGHDPEAIQQAIAAARLETSKPSLIACRTIIGQGSDKEGTSSTHGAPLGEENIRRTKERLGLDPDAHFAVDPDARAYLSSFARPEARAAWQARLDAHPDREAFLAVLHARGADLVARTEWPAFAVPGAMATRKSSAACLKAIVAANPHVIGGSADLAGSNGVDIGQTALTPSSFAGGTLHFGVREHAMGAICNGMALHGGVRPYGATFLIFHDYMRPAVRLAALMGVPTIFLYSHDSIFLGEDGPTHQPIETLFALRVIPNIRVWRPADALETAEAWKAALLREDGPSVIVLTRQDLPTLDRQVFASAEGLHRGGYALTRDEKPADLVIVATGSEVALALEARTQLAGDGITARVVSMPSVEAFLAQPETYRREVLPEGLACVVVEAGRTWGWERVVGAGAAFVGIDHFGASAPAEVLAEKFGFTVENVVSTCRGLLRA